jgi:hypothetical protein
MTNTKPSKITAEARERMRKTPAAEQLRQAKAALRKPDNPERTEPVQKGMLQ